MGIECFRKGQGTSGSMGVLWDRWGAGGAPPIPAAREQLESTTFRHPSEAGGKNTQNIIRRMEIFQKTRTHEPSSMNGRKTIFFFFFFFFFFCELTMLMKFALGHYFVKYSEN